MADVSAFIESFSAPIFPYKELKLNEDQHRQICRKMDPVPLARKLQKSTDSFFASSANVVSYI
jgi:hypothetical protein